MGLIKAGKGAIGSTLHDQWKEAIRCEELTNEVFEWVDCLSNYYTKAEIDTMLSTE